MPINSFENYPMSWKPDKQKLAYPVYYSLADLMEQDIKSGKLAANTKLPPQRELADFLDLNLSTITKAYKLCEMRGLILTPMSPHLQLRKIPDPESNWPSSIPSTSPTRRSGI